MAIGDTEGDVKIATKQRSFDATNTPAKYLTPPAGLAAVTMPGPIGRAQQQLSPVSSLADVNMNFGAPGQQDIKQTSFDATNTPAKYLAPANRQSSLSDLSVMPAGSQNQPIGSFGLSSPATSSQPDVKQASFDATSGPSLMHANLVTPVQQGQQPAGPSSLEQLGTNIGTSLLSGDGIKQAQAQTIIGPVPTATSPTVDPYGIQSVKDQNSLRDANMLANPTPADPAPAPGPITQDQYRPTGIGAGAQGGQIAARLGANGGAEFSNLPADQKSAQGLGQLSVSSNAQPASTQPSTLATAGGFPTSNPVQPSLSSLGSAGNLGDGVGVFSQAQPGDAALSAARFAKASEIRQGTADQSRLDQVLGAKWTADHTNIIHDSSKPVTIKQQQSDQGLQQTRDQAAGNVKAAQGLMSANLTNQAGRQQLRQASRLEDALTAAIAPNSTPEQKQQLQTLVDPTGAAGIDRQLKVASIDEKNASTAAKIRNTNKSGNLPVGLQKLEDGDIDAVSNVQSINTQMGNILGQLDNGSLVLGPVENRKNAAMNAAGISNPQSANYASFMSSLEKIRNDSLRLNKGPQTEGDANRAWNELLTNVNDPKVVKQRLGEIQAMNNKAAQVRLGMINSRRKNQGVGPLNVDDIIGATPQAGQPTQAQQAGAGTTSSAPAPQADQTPAAQTSIIPQIQNDDEFNKLQTGAQFIDPKGMHRRKP